MARGGDVGSSGWGAGGGCVVGVGDGGGVVGGVAGGGVWVVWGSEAKRPSIC